MGISDVASPGGWLQLYGVRVAKALVIGTVSLAAVLNVNGSINSNSVPGSSTGSILQVDGVTRRQEFKVTCTASGGALTSACIMKSPLTTTGTLLGFSLEAGNMAIALPGDMSFKKTRTSASGTVLTNGNNLSVGTGANLASMLAIPVSWNPADLLTFTTLTTPTGTVNSTRYNFQMWAIIADKHGS